MTRLANTTLKGMTLTEVKELVKKERNIGKREWQRVEENVFEVEYAFDKYLFVIVDENHVVKEVKKF
jgi:hypothetical protein